MNETTEGNLGNYVKSLILLLKPILLLSILRARRDARGTLRHPQPRRTRLRQLVPGRGGLPERMLLPPRHGEGLLLQAGSRVIPDLPRPQRPQGDRERDPMGRTGREV